MAPATDSGHRFLLAGLIHGAITFIVLVLFVDAWPYWKDAGQLMAAYGTGGLPHPTGFPLIASLGRLASLLPVGSMAFRINLLSAGSAAITSTVLFLLAAWLLEMNCGRPFRADGGTTVPPLVGAEAPPTVGSVGPITWILAWGAGWAFLAVRTVWFHSLAAEVYLPSAALSALLIACAMRSLVLEGDPHRGRTLRLLALGTGLASGLHVTALAAGAGSLALVAACGRGAHAPTVGGASAPTPPLDGRLQTWILAGQVTLLIGAGLLIQWYLPLRSWTGPWTKFADASDLGGWLGYATGRTIRSAFQGDIGAGGSLTTLSENAALYGTQLVSQAGPAVLLAVVGLLTLARRAPLAGLLAASAWGGDLLFTVVINPMGQKDFQTGVLSFFVIFVLAALGLARVLELLPSRRLLRPVMAAAVAAGLLVVPAASFPARHRALGANGLPYWYGRSILRPLPPGSLVLTTLDDASGLLLYQQLLENRRRDSLNLVVQNLAVPGLVSAQAARYGDLFFPEVLLALQDPEAGEPVAGDDPRALTAALVGYNLRRDNPVFWQPGQMAYHGVVRGYLEPGFPLGRVRMEVGPAPRGGRWAGVLDGWQVWRQVDPAEPDPTGRMVLADALGLAAALQVEEIQAGPPQGGPPPQGPVATAEALFGESLRLFDEDCRIWSNYAVLKGLEGQIDFAMEAAERAATLCPLHPPSRANQVRYRILSGNVREGLEAAAEISTLPVRAEIEPRLRRLADDLDQMGMGDAATALRRILD
ncbi:MAG: DUF2723 domain-containing protein [Pseudomonadota bacterium]